MLTVSKSSDKYKKRSQDFRHRDHETSETRQQMENTLTHRRNVNEVKEWKESKT